MKIVTLGKSKSSRKNRREFPRRRREPLRWKATSAPNRNRDGGERATIPRAGRTGSNAADLMKGPPDENL